MPEGFVIRVKGADYYVATESGEVRCSVRGRFRIGKSPEETLPVVGDNVLFKEEGGSGTSGPTGVITSVGKRKSIFARGDSSGRKKIKVLGANIDFIFLVHSILRPELNIRLLDRMIVAAECDNITPLICINKIDLSTELDETEKKVEPYVRMGYEVIWCCALDGRGIDRLRTLMTGVRSMMAGPSGAGKTSLLAALEPGLDIRVGIVSEKTGKGKHTTTHFEFHPIVGGGYLGDTPGIREFGIWGLSKQTLSDCFRDFGDFVPECRFSMCTHSHEPGCGVKEAMERGDISRERYESYLRILEELPDRTQ
ncbi:MAG: ribosome small subunit-dependent GTPase A [Candidatus Krumholzibacteriota bacterium]|nr:ribosome small subunit-dependent GTPase A [Candidatus Krumholzibacteriota bacterium]